MDLKVYGLLGAIMGKFNQNILFPRTLPAATNVVDANDHISRELLQYENALFGFLVLLTAPLYFNGAVFFMLLSQIIYMIDPDFFITMANNESSERLPYAHYASVALNFNLLDFRQNYVNIKELIVDQAQGMIYLWDYWTEYFSLADDELPSNVRFGGLNPDQLVDKFYDFITVKSLFYGLILLLISLPVTMFSIREIIALSADHFNFFFML